MDRTGDRDSLPTSHDLRRTLNDQAPLVDGPAMPDVVRVRVRRVVRTTRDLLDVPEDHTPLHEAVREDFADLSSLHVYASGSPAMVYATLDALVEAGMDAHQMRADVFAYAPRD